MPGYVTESRNRDQSFQVVTTDNQGGRTAIRVTQPWRQTTRSFRSGRRGPSEDEQLLQDAVLPSRIALNSQFDTGHEFLTTKTDLRSISHPSADVQLHGRYEARIRGPFILKGIGQDQQIAELSNLSSQTSPSDVQTLGARAIAATLPTAPSASLANFLVELKRDGIPSLVGSTILLKGNSFRHFADEFLNVEFGWKPLLNDLTAILSSVRHSSQTVQQMRRDSGRIVRRRFRFPIENTFTDKVVGVSAPDYTPIYGVSSYSLIGDTSTAVQDSVRTETWFSGAYTYYLDMGDELLNRFARYEQLANKLLGTRITPGVLWEAAPWSWFVDWFADVGTVLDNASALSSDGLVIRWGYLMRQTDVTRTLVVKPRFSDGPTFTTSNIWSCTRKQRWRATPYGFGLTESGFTARQWAILAALGMTKTPNTIM